MDVDVCCFLKAHGICWYYVYYVIFVKYYYDSAIL